MPWCCARSYGHREITEEREGVKFVSFCNYVILNVPCEVAVDWEDGKNERQFYSANPEIFGVKVCHIQ